LRTYDVAIIGGGISGLMAAYGLLHRSNNIRVILIDRGRYITKRTCPVILNKAATCCNCQPCSIMNGLAGAGAFSDGKYIITNEYGGRLSSFIGPEEALKYMENADSILRSFGATDFRYKPNNELKELCLINGLEMKQGEVKHLGTENNLEIMTKLIESLEKQCEIVTDCEVTAVIRDDHVIEMANHEYSVPLSKTIF